MKETGIIFVFVLPSELCPTTNHGNKKIAASMTQYKDIDYVLRFAVLNAFSCLSIK